MAVLMPRGVLLRKLRDLVRVMPRRTRVKNKWAVTRPKFPPTQLALQQFDATYSVQLGPLWPSVRSALLSEKKYGALLNNFSYEDVLSHLEAQGCRDFISDTEPEAQPCLEREPEGGEEMESTGALLKTSGFDDSQLPPLCLSPNIRCCVFPRGNITRFKSARPDMGGLLGYYLMDAASLLPCLALDVKEDHSVLDLCAAPGGKSLALLQSQSHGFLCMNDSSASRVSRLRNVLESYIPKHLLTENRLSITCFDGITLGENERNSFDRVLVDVPCTTDRHSLMEDENNIFSKSRTGERRTLPQLQLELLLAGIKAACPGGQILYSTCTVSKIQNQTVVQRAVHLAQEHDNIHVQVVSLRRLTHMFKKTFHFAPDVHLGELVFPHLAANFGPIYMCKLQRLT
ncbi:5-methylcytosine rRNA methyltransferase NSUN4 [Thalassophryne amazonica]|uniref:5-methylcytosine rRNA methyltransferase NSUN4 n=1 Tax=Thalassophryne amazonica TaxID=390379 RepID=UPI0014724CFA|nr:5-methylcytosine rRNA methyltransferase NSUN4 [Thalassophryne amazonica]